MKTQSTIRPDKFKINDLGRFKEVILCENIIETQNEENEIIYEYDMKLETVCNHDREQIIADIIHLKYTYDKEIALLNKGVLDNQDTEYIEYRNFVESVKLFVDKEA